MLRNSVIAFWFRTALCVTSVTMYKDTFLDLTYLPGRLPLYPYPTDTHTDTATTFSTGVGGDLS